MIYALYIALAAFLAGTAVCFTVAAIVAYQAAKQCKRAP